MDINEKLHKTCTRYTWNPCKEIYIYIYIYDKNFTSIYLLNKYVVLLPLNYVKLLLHLKTFQTKGKIKWEDENLSWSPKMLFYNIQIMQSPWCFVAFELCKVSATLENIANKRKIKMWKS